MYQSVTQYFFVIRELTARELKRKYARSVLGILWSILNPLLNMVVMSLIFSTMFRRSIANFPIYYLTGRVMWDMFSQATNSSLSALVDNKGLLIRTKLPKQIFILSRIYTALANFGYTLIAYLMMLVVFQVEPKVTMLVFFPFALMMLVFSTGIGYILATTYVFFADIRHLWGVITVLWMQLSALFYPVDRLPEVMQNVLEYNPIYLMIYAARSCVMDGRIPEIRVWVFSAISALLSFAIGWLVFRHNSNHIMEQL